ncbi:MAG: Gfo/Idh/MocA family oxidoreductase [Sedimentisphaerales bacterium]|nr:Gfo/Idh/MocA family oxidoreductase [Sedimentisphaerales bacterium]
MNKGIDRRDFMRSTAAIGAGLFLSPTAFGQGAAAGARKKDQINVALIGAGAEGQVLMDAIIKLGDKSNVQFRAVCDIWEQGNLNRVSRILTAYGRRYGHKGTKYVNYEDLLETEKDLDAAIVATPDFWHAPHAIACMKKGLHVYCEKEMSNDLAKAKEMVQVSKQMGKLLQIGHQRRSNPRYRYCDEKLLKEAKLLGRITHCSGQWNRSRAACEDLGWPEGSEIPQDVLAKYGYKDMKQFRNWRWYKGLGGGPIVDLGSHQIDIYSWFLGESLPTSVIASGGTDYWTDHEWYDNVITIYEFPTAQGLVRATYQTLTTNSANGYYEQFQGDEGTMIISESAARGDVYREGWVPEEKWQPWVDKGYITSAAPAAKPAAAAGEAAADVRESIKPAQYKIPVTMNVPYHQPHLVNFFESIRGADKLNCPGEVGYHTAVMVLRVNDAVAAGRKLELKPEDFAV